MGLKAMVEAKGYNGLIVGIRRDEDGTRAKERVFSARDGGGAWDVRDQKPEFWDQYNTDFPPGAHVRVHPLLHDVAHRRQFAPRYLAAAYRVDMETPHPADPNNPYPNHVASPFAR